MKIWVDDVREAPSGYRWCKSVQAAKRIISDYELMYKMSGCKDYYKIELIDLDHDAGDYVNDGGDYIRILDWLEQTNKNYPIRIHSMNPVGVANMRAIIERNGWTEVR